MVSTAASETLTRFVRQIVGLIQKLQLQTEKQEKVQEEPQQNSESIFNQATGSQAETSHETPAPAPLPTEEPKPDEDFESRTAKMGDLNNVSERQLQSAKAMMNVDFSAKAVRPGDEGYEYDKQVEFNEPEEDCGWDDSESESD